MDHQWEYGETRLIFLSPLFFFCSLSTVTSFFISFFSSTQSFSVYYPSPFCLVEHFIPSLPICHPPPTPLSWLTWVGETSQFVLPGSKITCLSVWMWRSIDDVGSPISNRGSYRSNKIKISIVCLAFSWKNWELFGLLPEVISLTRVCIFFTL